MNMEQDIFADLDFGKAALQKLAPVSENFRLYSAGWLGNKPEEFTVMKVTGAEFRVAKSGLNKGKLSIMIPGTTRTVYVSRSEIGAVSSTSKPTAKLAG